MATGSVKAVDDEDVRKRAQQRLMPRTAYEESHDAGSECNSRSISSASEELNLKLQALYDERQDSRRVHELQALAVSPAYQGLGLGASVLGTIEWLLGRDGDAVLELARGFDESSSLFIGAHLVSSSSSSQTEMGGRVYGIDLDEVKNALLERSGDAGGAQSDLKPLDKDAANGVETTSLGQVGQRKLVLVAIREIGNEDYYLRRGYKSVGTGVLPLGTWGSEAECTTVYMEKSI